MPRTNWNKCPNAKSAHIHQSWAWLNLKLFNLVFIFLAHSYTPAISCALIVFKSCPGTSVDFLTFENVNATEIVLTSREGHKRFSSQSLVVCHPNLLPTNPPSPWVWIFFIGHKFSSWAWCRLVPRLILCSSFEVVWACRWWSYYIFRVKKNYILK